MFKKHKCEICKRTFRQIEEFMQHMQVIHGSNSKYVCFECNKEFDNGEDFRAHARAYHTYKKGSFHKS